MSDMDGAIALRLEGLGPAVSGLDPDERRRAVARFLDRSGSRASQAQAIADEYLHSEKDRLAKLPRFLDETWTKPPSRGVLEDLLRRAQSDEEQSNADFTRHLVEIEAKAKALAETRHMWAKPWQRVHETWAEMLRSRRQFHAEMRRGLEMILATVIADAVRRTLSNVDALPITQVLQEERSTR